ncbi:MAG: amidohydrolase family protein [Betaproteobacteria bacterium]|nr:amidohydrolase family protein [Betaproteobacteria bacterium]MBV9359923.1 amidohydrolase family protein [Betaproteobacteria bacterium]
MTSRREFVAGAGALFVGCSLFPHAHAQTKRREVHVGGKRIRTIDVHAHCVIPEAQTLMKQKPPPDYGKTFAERLKQMDEQGVDMQALSINPTWYALERDLVVQVIQLQNEKLAEICARNPDRFVAFASVALQYPDLATQQLEQGVKKLGLRGAAIGASVEGVDFSDAKFHPFLRKAEELGVLLFIHPRGMPELKDRLSGNGYLDNTIGNPLETTIALSHLIYEGTLDQFPGLKICAAHGGGYLPSYAERSDHVCLARPKSCISTVPLKKKPTEYLRQLYFDSLIFSPEALRHLAAQVGASQIVMGTDDPFGWTKTSVDHILGTPELSDAQKAAILGETAAKLLGVST